MDGTDERTNHLLNRRTNQVRLAKFDEDKGELVRDPVTGLGAVCRPGEVGQVLGLIKEGDPMRRFDGYTDRAATEKKVARGVFAAGDRYFLSGDLMRQVSR